MHKEVFYGGQKQKKIQDYCINLKGRINNMSETENGTTEHVTIDTQISSFIDLANKLDNHYSVSDTNRLTDDFEAFFDAFTQLRNAIHQQDQWSAVAKLDHFSKVHQALDVGLTNMKSRMRQLMKSINRLTESEDQLDRFRDCLFALMEDHMDSVVRDNAREDMREIAQEEIDDAVSSLYITR